MPATAVASVKHLQLMAQGQRGIVRRATAPDQYIMTDILAGARAAER